MMRIFDNNNASSTSTFDPSPPHLVNRVPRNVDVSFLSILERVTEREKERMLIECVFNISQLFALLR
jgi:hypothetical protein